MTFSVVIPVYNADKYLENALLSIIRQEPEVSGELEILLIENGSLDKSAAICDEYAGKYDYIKAFHMGPIGAYAARREGMKLSEGKWLIFVDADDELKEDAVHELMGRVRSYGDYTTAPDIILYNWEKLQNGNKSTKNYPFDENKIYSGGEKKLFYDLMCDGDSLNALWNKCIKKTLAMEALKGSEMGFMNHGEDLLQTAELLDKAGAIAFIKKPLYLYRCNDEGLSGSYHERYLSDQIMAWKGFEAYADRWSDGNDGYKELITARKALTCTIAVKTLIYSELKRKEKEALLNTIEGDPFYREYAAKELPKWASEEDRFVHELQTDKSPHRRLMASGIKHDIKSFIKARIRN